jgi:hypothetical protein
MASFTGSLTLGFAAISMLLLSLAAVAAEFPTLPKNVKYEVVRARLLKDGYTPVPQKGGCDDYDNRCKRYPETEACSGTGMGYCKFIWHAPDNGIYEIVTIGDDTIFDGATCTANCRGKSGAVEGVRPAKSVPWEKHPDLSWPATPITVQTSNGAEDIGTTKGYFERYSAKGIACDAVDAPRRAVTITCRDPIHGTKTVYAGGFVGAGYLVVSHISVDGKLLDPLEMVEHMRRIVKQGPENE